MNFKWLYQCVYQVYSFISALVSIYIPYLLPQTNKNNVHKVGSCLPTTADQPRCPMFRLNHFTNGESYTMPHLPHLDMQRQTSDCTDGGVCTAALVDRRQPYTDINDKAQVMDDALKYLQQYHEAYKTSEEEYTARVVQVTSDIERTGTYTQTIEEVSYGAKLAWRNNARCIGRALWNRLQVLDARSCTTPEEVFEACVKHLRTATNNGKIISVITVLPPASPGKTPVRIWNQQLLQFAGYAGGAEVVGDPGNVKLTEAIEKLGWEGKGGEFDVLPLVIEMNGKPHFFELPDDAKTTVSISHPKYSWFADLNLQWFPLPGLSGMTMSVGGVRYPAPFNGWFICTEIVRDLCDVQRYNKLPKIIEGLGLQESDKMSLALDRATIEANYAVLHSFQKAGVTMTDHITISKQFERFYKKELSADRAIPADWVWLVPPLGSTSSLFHLEMINFFAKPCFESQSRPY